MKLSEIEKAQIRGIIYSPQWETVKLVAGQVINKFRSENTIQQSEWETLRDTLLKEGKAQGVEQFFQELVKLANESAEK
mgnify:CR=1 FL=1